MLHEEGQHGVNNCSEDDDPKQSLVLGLGKSLHESLIHDLKSGFDITLELPAKYFRV